MATVANPFTSQFTPALIVLGSSFNPPTLAHFALANAPGSFPSVPDYNTRLLLLSVRNAVKLLQEGAATLSQGRNGISVGDKIRRNDPSSSPNVAVGLVNEPPFITKYSALRRLLGGRLVKLTSSPSLSIFTQLTFLMGPSQYIHGVV